MASPSKIHLGVEETGIIKVEVQTTETAAKTSELLQENHDKYHIFFNKSGFHNHIAHQLLTLYGLGATSPVIEREYQSNAVNQRPSATQAVSVVDEMANAVNFKKYLGKEKYYHDFLKFWQNEMERKGWENVLNEYLFAGDERADDMLGRMFAGFLHPLIHLGFGIEFHQPAIIAEALAQASLHDAWITPYLIDTEKATKSLATSSSKTLPQLLDEIRADKKLSTAAEWNDGNKVRDGVLKRAPDEMIKYASQWTVSDGELEEKTAEMINASIYFTAAAQRPPKQVKMDFYFMHCANCSIFFPTFNAQSWLSTASKVRLLQWKGYLDLAMYASRRSPPLLLEEISGYVPKKPENGKTKWDGLRERLFAFHDDGHAVKLARAVAAGEAVCKKYEGEDWCMIKGPMWEKVGNMVVDSVEDERGATWVRSAGFEQAWRDYGERPKRGHL